MSSEGGVGRELVVTAEKGVVMRARQAEVPREAMTAGLHTGDSKHDEQSLNCHIVYKSSPQVVSQCFATGEDLVNA